MEGLKDFLLTEIEGLVFRPVTEDESLVAGAVLDSITLVELAVAIEDETGVAIPFTEISEEHFDTVLKIEAFVKSKSNQS